ncbi:MAG: cobalamin biosynthesis protein [Tateyamaria sp.]|uniref:cobalamin biosynthesis protein n=1 Tax=Tateyamaria sp. TaxID=1929288 RepID=UPI00329A8EA5
MGVLVSRGAMEPEPMIVAGFGFTTRATSASLRAALYATGFTGALTKIASASDKVQTAAFTDLATNLDVPVAAISAEQIASAQTATQSTTSKSARDTGSVAEAAALAAAGPGARLLVTRHISADRMATCAIAKGADT